MYFRHSAEYMLARPVGAARSPYGLLADQSQSGFAARLRPKAYFERRG